MQLIYSLEEPPNSFTKSIFLAGPTPRNQMVKSWRPEAIKLLREAGYNGVVFVPETRENNKVEMDRGLYPAWEHRMMAMSDLVLFWVPRDLTLLNPQEMKMPAFTTNVEFGLCASSGKAMFGPPNGQKNNYLSFVANKFHIPQLEKLEDLINEAMKRLEIGALRVGGEREVPLELWNSSSFQSWYKSQKEVGNRLDGFNLQWAFRIGKKKDKIFYWAAYVNIYVGSEERNKTNECVISRFDISSVVLYKSRPSILDTEVVLVREFRSPARNSSGFVWELPGGSSPHGSDPLETISEETLEEVGLTLDKNRFKLLDSRQLAATMSSHHAALYSAELTEEELSWLKSQKGIPHGADYPDNPTGERAYTEILTLREILGKNLTDWSNIGMILSIVR